MELVEGRPQDKRIDKEERVYDLLDQLNIDYQRIDHEEANTMEVCLEIEKSLKSTICKNLFLVNSNKSQYYLLMLKENKKFKTKVISKQINSSRLSFGSDEKMLEYLDITPGSVSLLGLMNDHDFKVQLLMDKDLLQDEYLGCHPCINTSSLRIKMKDVFEKIMPFLHHEPIFVEVYDE
ncbi:prolyl-tRNA synthetase associated domain-containing protein [Faecalibacillus faecis]|uniref:prolyl-tRNA synthetase associated domain-containing protein n=1 Tax=Faecalibacillus faecis TaxID=1982628 RepID=UPI000E4EF2E0|nr:prolyl-tRNA synthetase associated domain-containing protein [Faecalibacillus faecis]RHB08104.1 prolyl-tRNA synthetase associated domain-containing protein [Coprobacillus sp. AM42-12AC]RHQ88246.1 prolyl-tRNA synthetase associated domain-containing protein [Coprobacillus sp. AF21-8LB]